MLHRDDAAREDEDAESGLLRMRRGWCDCPGL